MSSSIIWEDGRVFLSDSLALPFFETLAKPYSGYYHLIPRLVAEVASPSNLLAVPRLYILCSIIFSACVLALPVLNIFDNLMRTPWRIGYVMLCAVIPVPLEILGNITCLHWYAFWGLMLLCLADLRSLRPGWLLIMIPYAFITVFSSPPTIILVPLAIVQVVLHRHNKCVIVFDASVVVFCAAFFLLCSSLNKAVSLPSGSDMLLFVAQTGGFKSVMEPAVGRDIALAYLQNPKVSILAFTLLLVAVFAFAFRLLRHGSAKKSVLLLSIVYAIIAPLVLAGITRPNYIEHFVRDRTFSGADRYFAVPVFLFLLLLVQGISAGLRRFPMVIRIALLAVMLLLYSIPVVQNFRYGIPDPAKYNWRADVIEYYQAVVRSRESTVKATPWTISIYPGDGWCVSLPSPTSFTEPERQRIDKVLARCEPSRSF